MKKLYTLLLSVVVALSASAAINTTKARAAMHQLEASQISVQHAEKSIMLKKSSEVLNIKSAPARIKPNEDWADAGTAVFTDPWIMPFFANTAAEAQSFVDNHSWEVPVQKSTIEGRFKLIQPFAQPGFIAMVGDDFIVDAQDIIIDAQNPDQLEIEPQYIGTLKADPDDPEDEDLTFYVTDIFNHFLKDYNAQTIIAAGFSPSTYEDGKITINLGVFGTEAGQTGANWLDKNGETKEANGKVVFSDAKDYSINGAANTDCWNTGDFYVTWKAGEDIASLKYMSVAGAWFDADEETISDIETQLAQKLEDIDLEGKKDLDPVGKDFGRGPATIFFIAYDADGTRVKAQTVKVLIEPDNFYSTWTNIGRCKYTDDIIASTYSSRDPQTGASSFWNTGVLEALVQESDLTPGLYRIVNPYTDASWEYAALNLHYTSDHRHYLYIDASVPDKVSIPESYVGYDFLNINTSVISTNYFYLIDGQKTDDSLWGKLENGVITFPPTTFTENGALKDSAILSGQVGDRYGTFYGSNIHSAFRLDLNTAGISDVTIDLDENAPVEYFNLQGVRVAAPAAGELVIKRQGEKVEKVIIR